MEVIWMPTLIIGTLLTRAISCTSNLKQIGLSLIMYAHDNNGYLPHKSNDSGLEMLRVNNYLTEYIDESHVGYIYRGGLRYFNKNNESNDKIPVVWDKPENHEDYGNVLFLDGHVEGFEGKDWMKKAGIKETANKAPDNITKP